MGGKNLAAIAIATILLGLIALGGWQLNRMFDSNIQAMENNDEAIAVMPLGDSITDGYNVPGGYRIDLWQTLVEQRGYAIDFVGSLQNGPPQLPDKDHEGHSGWRIDQIRKRISGWLRKSEPDVVLLLIGTNDIVQNYALETAPQRWLALIRDIQQQQPGTHILAASIPPIDDPVLNQRAETFNHAIADLVAKDSDSHPAITFVDVYSHLSMDDLADGVHPNRQGHRRIAAAWQSPLSQVLDRYQSKAKNAT
jgi:lysophospholipase L1-like esterase